MAARRGTILRAAGQHGEPRQAAMEKLLSDRQTASDVNNDIAPERMHIHSCDLPVTEILGQQTIVITFRLAGHAAKMGNERLPKTSRVVLH